MGDKRLLYDRASRVRGYDQAALENSHIGMVGAGGLGGEVAHGLVRKGIGALTISDFDAVAVSNLQRQFFMKDDVGVNKAFALARNLTCHATGVTQISAFSVPFQDAINHPQFVSPDVMVVGVDNNPTRIAASAYCLEYRIPAVFLAVDQHASKGAVFVQEVGADQPCFVCYDPNAPADNRVFECAGSSIEILKATAGITLYAIDSLLMNRHRSWHVKDVFFNDPDGARRIAKRATCRVCGGANS